MQMFAACGTSQSASHCHEDTCIKNTRLTADRDNALNVAFVASLPQANVDRTADPAEWRLDALAGKMVQYCPLLEGLTGNELAANVGGACDVQDISNVAT